MRNFKINITVEKGKLNVLVHCDAFDATIAVADFGARITKAISARS